MLQALLILTLGFTNVTHVWMESSTTPVFPDATLRSTSQQGEKRLYAARGERESFQIAIRSSQRTLEGVQVHAPAIHEHIDAPEIHRVGYAQMPAASQRRPDDHGDRGFFPGPLLPYEPFDAPPEETQVLWVTYHVGRDAPAGVHRGSIEIIPDRGRHRTIDVTIEVHDFSLPEQPSLETLFWFDREAVQQAYDWPLTDLDAWESVYELLSQYRIGYNLWQRDLVPVDEQGSATTGRFEQHLDLAGEHGLPVIDLGQGQLGLSAFPPPPEGFRNDPLRSYLRPMADWLDARGWVERAIIQPVPPVGRDHWLAVREALFRTRRADERIRRLWTGPFHPYFERYAEVWAVPLRFHDRTAHKRLSQGLSLKAAPAHAASNVYASSSGSHETLQYEAAPADGYDGSMHTYWWSEQEPDPNNPEWFAIHFEEPVRARDFEVDWRPGYEPETVRVRTSFDGRAFNHANVRWDHHFSMFPGEPSWSEARFDMNKTFRAIRFEFSRSASGGPVGVANVQFGELPPIEGIEAIPPVSVWLAHHDGDFPTFAPDSPAESRLMPWVCWGLETEGYAGAHINRWPPPWRIEPGDPERWILYDPGAPVLFYPGENGLLPSVQAEQMRDGLEDYEYLKRLAQAVEDGQITNEALERLIAPQRFFTDMEPAEIESWIEAITDVRVQIGRALSGIKLRAEPEGEEEDAS